MAHRMRNVAYRRFRVGILWMLLFAPVGSLVLCAVLITTVINPFGANVLRMTVQEWQGLFFSSVLLGALHAPVLGVLLRGRYLVPVLLVAYAPAAILVPLVTWWSLWLGLLVIFIGPPLFGLIGAAWIGPQPLRIHLLHCTHCGYNLTASGGEQCPECGHPVTPQQQEHLQRLMHAMDHFAQE